jgi:hypothetical protein
MAITVRSVEYFYCTVQDRPGQAAELLAILSEYDVELVAFSIMPTGPTHTQLMLFPQQPTQLAAIATRARLELVGPQHALFVCGDNSLGALLEVHKTLADEGINVYASNGVTDGGNRFGYVLYVRPEDFKRAATVVGVSGAPSWRPSGPLQR